MNQESFSVMTNITFARRKKGKLVLQHNDVEVSRCVDVLLQESLEIFTNSFHEE